jgi:hypothetical protein
VNLFIAPVDTTDWRDLSDILDDDGVALLELEPHGRPVRSDVQVTWSLDPRSRSLPPRARLDVEVWLTKGEMAQRLDDVRAAAGREFELGILELEVATARFSEHVALTLAGFCLARDDIPAALAVLRGWARNPRRIP